MPWKERVHRFEVETSYTEFYQFAEMQGWDTEKGHARCRIQLPCGRFRWDMATNTVLAFEWKWLTWED